MRLIDADALPYSRVRIFYGLMDDGTHIVGGFNAVVMSCAIREAPTVDAVEVVHGRWIHCKGKSNLWYCSVCGEKILYNPTRRTYNIEKRPVHEVNKHCRNCGAKMDGGNEDG